MDLSQLDIDYVSKAAIVGLFFQSFRLQTLLEHSVCVLIKAKLF